MAPKRLVLFFFFRGPNWATESQITSQKAGHVGTPQGHHDAVAVLLDAGASDGVAALHVAVDGSCLEVWGCQEG